MFVKAQLSKKYSTAASKDIDDQISNSHNYIMQYRANYSKCCMRYPVANQVAERAQYVHQCHAPLLTTENLSMKHSVALCQSPIFQITIFYVAFTLCRDFCSGERLDEAAYKTLYYSTTGGNLLHTAFPYEHPQTRNGSYAIQAHTGPSTCTIGIRVDADTQL